MSNTDKLMVPDGNRRVLRTTVASSVATFVGLVIVLPDIINLFDSYFGIYLGDNVRVWLLGVAAFVTLLTAFVNKLMNLPIINHILSTYTPFGTEYKPKVPPVDENP